MSTNRHLTKSSNVVELAPPEGGCRISDFGLIDQLDDQILYASGIAHAIRGLGVLHDFDPSDILALTSIQEDRLRAIRNQLEHKMKQARVWL